MYYHHPVPGHADSGTTSVNQGQDLLNEYGTAWQLPVFGITTSSRYRLPTKVLHDGFLAPNMPESHLAQKERRCHCNAQSQAISPFRDKFHVDLAIPDQPPILMPVGNAFHEIDPYYIFWHGSYSKY